MPATIKWNGGAFEKRVRSGMTKNLTAAGRELKAALKQTLSVSGRTVTLTTSASGNVKKKRGALGSSPSAPGEAPHKQTGALIRSLFSRLANGGRAVRVGGRGAALEVGDQNMKARPWLRNTFKKMKSRLAEVACQRIN